MSVEGTIDGNRAKRCLKILTKTFFKNYIAFTNFWSPADICLFKVNDRNTTTMCEICSKLTIKTLEQRHWLVSLLLTLNRFHKFCWCFSCRLSTSKCRQIKPYIRAIKQATMLRSYNGVIKINMIFFLCTATMLKWYNDIRHIYNEVFSAVMRQWLINIFLVAIIVITIIYYYSARQFENFGIYSSIFQDIML